MNTITDKLAALNLSALASSDAKEAQENNKTHNLSKTRFARQLSEIACKVADATDLETLWNAPMIRPRIFQTNPPKSGYIDPYMDPIVIFLGKYQLTPDGTSLESDQAACESLLWDIEQVNSRIVTFYSPKFQNPLNNKLTIPNQIALAILYYNQDKKSKLITKQILIINNEIINLSINPGNKKTGLANLIYYPKEIRDGKLAKLIRGHLIISPDNLTACYAGKKEDPCVSSKSKKNLFSLLPDAIYEEVGTFLDPLSLSAMACTNKETNTIIKELAQSAMKQYFQEQLPKEVLEYTDFETLWQAKMICPSTLKHYDLTNCKGVLDIFFSQEATVNIFEDFEKFNSKNVVFHTSMNINNPKTNTLLFATLYYERLESRITKSIQLFNPDVSLFNLIKFEGGRITHTSSINISPIDPVVLKGEILRKVIKGQPLEDIDVSDESDDDEIENKERKEKLEKKETAKKLVEKEEDREITYQCYAGKKEDPFLQPINKSSK